MNRLFFMSLEALLAAVFFAPALPVLNKYRFHSRKKTILYFLLCVYLAAMYAVAGLPNILYTAYRPRFNFVPFLYMFSDWENTLLNLLLFMPLGFFLPVLWQKFGKLGSTAVFGFCVSLLIEVLQIFTFRATDVNDLMTNTLGTVLGYGAAQILLTFLPVFSPEKHTEDLSVICGLVFGVMFFLQPFLSSLVWEWIYM